MFDETHAEKPPLGQIRDLNREEAKRRDLTPYKNIADYPELVLSLTEAAQALNQLRGTFQLPGESFDTHSVRLIAPETFDSSKDFKSSEEGAGAFFDPITRLCFVKLKEEEYRKSIFERLAAVYNVTHELAHKGMNGVGIGDYSFQLNEGFADVISGDILNNRVLPNILTPNDFQARGDYVEIMRPEIEGIPVSAQDLVALDPQLGALPYSRIPEMHVVRAIQKTKPDIYQSLLASALDGKPDRARTIVQNEYGSEAANAFGNPKVAPRELVRMISAK